MLELILVGLAVSISAMALRLKLGTLLEQKARAQDPQLKITSREPHPDQGMTVLTIRNNGAVVYQPEVRPGREVDVELSRAIKHGGHVPRLDSGADVRLTVTHVPVEGETYPPVKFYFGLKFQTVNGRWRQHDYFVNNEDLSLRSAGRGKKNGWRNLESRRIRKLGQYPWQDPQDPDAPELRSPDLPATNASHDCQMR